MQYRNYSLALFVFLALTGLAILSVLLVRAPEALPASAPAIEFSAERAMAHVQQVAKAPHAMGTKAHAEARNYLLSQMQQLGLEAEVQEATVASEPGYITQVGYVYNVIGRLKGAWQWQSSVADGALRLATQHARSWRRRFRYSRDAGNSQSPETGRATAA